MIFERLAEDTLLDDYFKALYSKAAKLLAHNIFQGNNGESLNEKEFQDLLRFSDLLSNSKNSIARNTAFQVVSALNPFYKDNPYYKTHAHSVLAKLGNFPGISYLVEVNSNKSELPYLHEIDKAVKRIEQAVPETDNLVFTDSQFELYSKISNSKFFSFSGPTSMGKSFIIKSFIRKAVSNKPPENIVIMVPTRALINQFSMDLNKELREILDSNSYKVVTNSNVSEVPNEKSQLYVFVLTPERLLSFLSQKGNPSIGYLFVDEAHKLASEKDYRSITAYSAIAQSMQLNPNINLYFASPNVTNPEVFLKLFNKDLSFSYKTIESPVSQNLFLIDLTKKEVTNFLENDTYTFTPPIVQHETNIFEVISEIGKGQSNIIYCSSRFQAVSKAEELYERLLTQENEVSKDVKKVISQIKAYIHKDYYLAEFLSKGVAFHFGNLPQIIRNKIEELFKNSEIEFIFCTSTLLEGVNLPAKNIFILHDKIGGKHFKPIDFWNLAGRAGRLRHELSGNIFCVKEDDKNWKNTKILAEKGDIFLKPTIVNYIDSKLKKIESILEENPEIKNETKQIEGILRYIANIISIDTLEIEKSSYKSVLIERLIQENKEEILNIAKSKNKEINIPLSVLRANESIKLKIQNKVYNELSRQSGLEEEIKLAAKVDYGACLSWLNRLYYLYEWKEEEGKLKNKDQLKYYAVLMNQWINGVPLSVIIGNSIDHYQNNNKSIKKGFRPKDLEVFDKENKLHVNVLISNIIDDIEKVLRFVLEKYFNSYYSILCEVLGDRRAGVNWATFLEYGTQNSIMIALQNLGLSRHSASYLYSNHKESLVIESDKLVKIHYSKLQNNLKKEDVEYDEIKAILL